MPDILKPNIKGGTLFSSDVTFSRSFRALRAQVKKSTSEYQVSPDRPLIKNGTTKRLKREQKSQRRDLTP